MRWMFAALAMSSVVLTACQPTCQSSCTRFYSDEECGAGPAGQPTEEAIQTCISVCQEALQVPGEDVDSNDRRFNPDFVAQTNESHTLTTEREAAAWMDCVWSFEDDQCFERLDAQYCVKIF